MKSIFVLALSVVALAGMAVIGPPAAADGCAPGETVPTASAIAMSPAERESCGFGQRPSPARVAQAALESKRDPKLAAKLAGIDEHATKLPTWAPSWRHSSARMNIPLIERSIWHHLRWATLDF